MKLGSLKHLLAASALVVLAGCSGMQSEELEVTEPMSVEMSDSPDMQDNTMGERSGDIVPDYEPDTTGATMEMPSVSSGDLETQMMADVGTNKVHFDFDSSAIDEEAQQTLRQVASFIQQNPVNKIIIEGHCDERGTREYNLALGDRRAVSVKKYLVGLGVAPSKMTTISYGKERPANPAHTEEAWAENRRAIIKFK